MERPEFANGCLYHLYNRGVDKRNIFLDTHDYFRFINGLYEFNDLQHVINFRKRYENTANPEFLRERENLVDVICFCLMPNHFHLLVRQLLDDGIPKFMQKSSTSYAMSFNKKLKRTGRLYESRFKAILIEDDEYLMHLSRYIHLNPLDLIQPDWRKKGIRSRERAIKFLEGYKWSTFHDYTGKDRFQHIIDKEPMGWYFKSHEDYRKYILSWTKKDMEEIEDLIFPEHELIEIGAF